MIRAGETIENPVTGERIVFLPYTREVFASTQQWTQARNLFPEPSGSSAGYDEAALV